MNTCSNPDNIPGCIRKMTGCERVFFMSPACTVMMAARIRGKIDIDKFNQALSTVTRIHPLLDAKVIFDKQHEAWFSSDSVPGISLRIIPRISEDQWVDELKNEARIPFDIGKGPLIKYVLLQSEEESDFLVFCNHSICDGMALAGLIKEILCRYGKPEGKIQVIVPPVSQDLLKPRRNLKGMITNLFAFHANRKWRKNPYHFGPEEYSTLYEEYWKNRSPGIVMMEFDKDESVRLLEKCREHQVTVGSAVSSAFLGAYQEIIGEFSSRQQAIMVPFDIRRRSEPPIGDVFCFCVGSLRLPFSYQIKKTFWENTVILNKAIHLLLKNPDPSGLDMPPFDHSLLDAMAAFAPFSDLAPKAYSQTEIFRRFIQDSGNIAMTLNRNFQNMIPGFIPSNLGKIEIPESNDELYLERLVFLPSASEINPLVMGGIGTDDRMTFTLTYVDPPAKTGISPEPEMIRIRNRALELLGFPEKVNEKVIGR